MNHKGEMVRSPTNYSTGKVTFDTGEPPTINWALYEGSQYNKDPRGDPTKRPTGGPGPGLIKFTRGHIVSDIRKAPSDQA